MSRDLKPVILCEDLQSACLLRRYLRERGFSKPPRIVALPATCGEQHVRDNYAKEVKAQRAGLVAQVLVVHIDADKGTVLHRHSQLDKALSNDGQKPRAPDEPIALVVPRYETETWLHHYCGRANVDETAKYPKFEKKEADAAKPTVDALIKMVNGTQAPPQNLPSIATAVAELRRLP